MVSLPSIGRQLNLLDYAITSLLRKKLKNSGVLLVFATVIFLFSSLQLMSRGLEEAAHKLLVQVPDITVQKLSAGRQVGFSANQAEKLSSIFGIVSIKPRVWGYYFDEANGANYTVLGYDRPTLDQQFASAFLSQGEIPREPGEVVISEDLVTSLNLQSRQSFSLFRPDLSMGSFTVSGIFHADSATLTADTMLMSLEDARDLFALPEGEITDLLIEVGNPNEIEMIAARISERIAGVRVITAKQIQKTYEVIFSWRAGYGVLILVTSLVAFTILAWDKASGLTREDVREIAILKILGWQAADVMTVRMWESIIIATLSLLLGYGFAWVHIVWVEGILFRPLMMGWSVLRPGLEIVPPFVLQDFLLLFGVSIIPYLCATVIPAWKSAVVRTDDVM